MENKIFVKVKKPFPDAKLPSYAHPGDAGMDIYSYENKLIKADEIIIVSTGISLEFPENVVALIWDKSGLAFNNGIKTMAGVIEYTYRGEYKIVLLNSSKKNYEIKKGDKICQVLFQPILTAEIIEVNELSQSSRGENSFGSTGK